MRIPSASLLVVVCAMPVQAQVIAEMTPQRIQQALVAARQRPPVRYALRAERIWMEFDTPFLRVSHYAAEAPGSDGAVLATADRVAPELRIVAAPEPLGDEVPGIKSVVAEQPDGSKVLPRSLSRYVEYAQTTRRHRIEIRGIRAVFPIAALKPGVRFRFQMTRGPALYLAPEPDWFGVPR